jgi:hypothetical protein
MPSRNTARPALRARPRPGAPARDGGRDRGSPRSPTRSPHRGRAPSTATGVGQTEQRPTNRLRVSPPPAQDPTRRTGRHHKQNGIFLPASAGLPAVRDLKRPRSLAHSQKEQTSCSRPRNPRPPAGHEANSMPTTGTLDAATRARTHSCCNLERSRGVIGCMGISGSGERQWVAGRFWGVGIIYNVPPTGPLDVSDASCDSYE